MAPKRRSRGTADFPAVAKLLLADYQDFVAGGADDSVTKVFAARHAAGRAALSHLEQLIKLAQEAGTEEDAKEVAATITEWRARMPPQAPEDPEADDQGTGC